ncbi:MAG: VOC family protein [Candidatus Zixiibacteriota bacterium]
MADNMPKHGTFCWNELVTRDTGAAGKFYSQLLGWKLNDSGMPGMNYTMFKVDGMEQSAGGMVAMPAQVPKEVPSHWMAYITVDDIDATCAKVKELGGQVLVGPMPVPNMGRFITVLDPTGAAVSFFQFE